MIRNERIEEAFTNLMDIVKQELANGCPTEISADGEVTNIYLSRNPDVYLFTYGTAESGYFGTFSRCRDDIFNKAFSNSRKKVKKDLIAQKERELEKLKKGL